MRCGASRSVSRKSVASEIGRAMSAISLIGPETIRPRRAGARREGRKVCLVGEDTRTPQVLFQHVRGEDLQLKAYAIDPLPSDSDRPAPRRARRSLLRGGAAGYRHIWRRRSVPAAPRWVGMPLSMVWKGASARMRHHQRAKPWSYRSRAASPSRLCGSSFHCRKWLLPPNLRSNQRWRGVLSAKCNVQLECVTLCAPISISK